ncbi:MAG: peroxiredoxin-like family protein [Gammaproteobacteria bacterium]|nr:peroxiredoxin-like family protein [Gammaproteobacteria bacterium]
MAKLFPVIAILFLAACGDSSAPDRERIFESADQVLPLFEGMPAPQFTAKQPDGSAFRFDPATLQRPAVIFFYRGGWCPYCNAQLMELRTIEEEIDAMGFDQLYLSADSPATLSRGLEGLEEPFDYTILSDNDLVAAKSFGIAFRVDDATVKKYRDYNIDLEAASGRDHHALPVPAVFIIDTHGLIRFAYVNPDYRFRLAPNVLLAAAEAALDDRNVRERMSGKSSGN